MAIPETNLLAAKDMFELADLLKGAKDRKKELESLTKTNNAEIEQLETLLAEQMINEETPRFTRNGKTFYLTDKFFANAVPERKTELYQWMKDHGYEHMVQETVHAQTLKAFAKELLSEEDTLPDGLDQLINTYSKPVAGMRKGK